ncbi:MAG: hypothetical protein AAF402_05550 [Pseudomonadota bacterium]
MSQGECRDFTPPTYGHRSGGYGEEKVQTPNGADCKALGELLWVPAAKAVVGKNQQVVGSNPSSGSSLLADSSEK